MILQAASFVIVGFVFVWSILQFLWSLQHNLKNEAVLITGCDHGFGHLIARKLAQRGLRVFAGVLNPSGDGANSLKRDFSSDRLEVVSLDVTLNESVTNAVKIIEKQVGDKGLWALINNAGIMMAGDVEFCPVEHHQRVWDVNVGGPIRCVRACLPLLRRTRGRVINIGSIACTVYSPPLAAYDASKAALFSLNECLLVELHKFGILSIIVRPAYARTNIVDPEPRRRDHEKIFPSLPETTQKVYTKEYMKSYFKDFCEGSDRATDDLSHVIDAVCTAVTARFPRRDYILTWTGFGLCIINRLLPQSIIETIILLFRSPHYNLDLTSQALPNSRRSSYLF